ncbi:predicted protein [Histoplasma capsulatum var. duboisii H88]|uniref:Predicted protein n=1 Tax=Ajellomyces capsulatus (strain H88) TaxID=544711 RepID=F0UGZ3_AJEC8|nr:predicted protein [Histoplasma capsulatum var. duboisii H88]QSS55171.1 hypothetical protein I7I53_02981 [Histoplasma capsulatum var. duboisii H88]
MAAQALKVNPQGNQYKKESTKLAAGSLSDPWVDGYGDRIETKKPGATSTEQTARQTDPPPQRRIAIREQGQCNQFDTQREVKGLTSRQLHNPRAGRERDPANANDWKWPESTATTGLPCSNGRAQTDRERRRG